MKFVGFRMFPKEWLRRQTLEGPSVRVSVPRSCFSHFAQWEPELSFDLSYFASENFAKRCEACMKIKTVPPGEMLLGLAVGSTVLLIEIGFLALLID
jgi:hypothetical protein